MPKNPRGKRYVAKPLPADLQWPPEKIYTVEFIVAAEVWKEPNRGRHQWVYLTKWDKWDPDFNTWEPKENFKDPDIIREFWKATTRGTEPNPSHLRVGKQFGSSEKYQVQQIGSLKILKIEKARCKREEALLKRNDGSGTYDNSDNSDSSGTSDNSDDLGTSEVPEQAPEPLFLSDDEENGSERETEQLLGRETTDDDDTVVPSSEQLEDDNAPKRRVPVPTPAQLMDAMSMTPRRSNPSYDMDIDPREQFQLDKAFKHPVAYTNITEFLPNTVSPRDIEKIKTSDKSTPRRRRSDTKTTSRTPTKQKSSIPSNHPHFYSAASTPTKSRHPKPPPHVLHQPTGFDSRFGGTRVTPKRTARGERTTTVSLEDRTTPFPFERLTKPSRGPTRRKMQHLDITYSDPTWQTKDSFRSNLSLAPPGMRSVRFADLPANAPADTVSISHVSATASEGDNNSEMQGPTTPTPNTRTATKSMNLGRYNSWRENSEHNDSDDEEVRENVDDEDDEDGDDEIRLRPKSVGASFDEMMQYVEVD